MKRVALVTGGSRGIGRGIALELARIDFDLVVNFRGNSQAAELTRTACIEAARERGFQARVECCQADIANTEARKHLLDFTRKTFGRLDLLVNNAGVAPEVRADLLESSEESFDRLMEINVKAPFFLTQLAARWMIEQVRANPNAPSPQIITISSVSAYAPSVNRGEYCVSKAALSMLTPLFATRLAEHGIHVFEIRPGIIATDMTAAVKEKYDKLIAEGLTPLPRWGQPGDIGRAVASIAQGSFPFSTGDVFNVDGGFHLRRL